MARVIPLADFRAAPGVHVQTNNKQHFPHTRRARPLCRFTYGWRDTGGVAYVRSEAMRVEKPRCGCRSNLYSSQDICGRSELVPPQLSNTPRAAFAIPGRARCAAPDGHCVAVSVTGHTMAVRETRGLSGCAEHGAWAPKRRGRGLRRSARSRRPRSVRPASEHACGVFSRVEAHRAPQAREAGVPQTELDDFFRAHEVRASDCARPWIFDGSLSARCLTFVPHRRPNWAPPSTVTASTLPPSLRLPTAAGNGRLFRAPILSYLALQRRACRQRRDTNINCTLHHLRA